MNLQEAIEASKIKTVVPRSKRRKQWFSTCPDCGREHISTATCLCKSSIKVVKLSSGAVKRIR